MATRSRVTKVRKAHQPRLNHGGGDSLPVTATSTAPAAAKPSVASAPRSMRPSVARSTSTLMPLKSWLAARATLLPSERERSSSSSSGGSSPGRATASTPVCRRTSSSRPARSRSCGSWMHSTLPVKGRTCTSWMPATRRSASASDVACFASCRNHGSRRRVRPGEVWMMEMTRNMRAPSGLGFAR